MWGRMVEFLEGSIDIAFHGYVDIFLVMVPIKAEASVEGAFPVDSEGVVILEGVDEMESVIF